MVFIICFRCQRHQNGLNQTQPQKQIIMLPAHSLFPLGDTWTAYDSREIISDSFQLKTFHSLTDSSFNGSLAGVCGFVRFLWSTEWNLQAGRLCQLRPKRHSHNVIDLFVQQVGRSFNESTISVMEQVAEGAVGNTTFSQRSINSRLSGSQLKESPFSFFPFFLTVDATRCWLRRAGLCLG